ncbi:MAG: hypothetical protein V3V86_09165, partial [Gammaproteobacteria bacterium]
TSSITRSRAPQFGYWLKSMSNTRLSQAVQFVGALSLDTAPGLCRVIVCQVVENFESTWIVAAVVGGDALVDGVEGADVADGRRCREHQKRE